jgi:putative hydrolase of HD superfamily
MINNEKILRFYLLATTLKNKIRQGSIYWNVSAQRRESVAEHIYDTCILAISIHSEYSNVNLQKVLQMLIIHELEEIIIGDITPFDNVSDEEKNNIGENAVLEILSDLKSKEELFNLTEEFNQRITPESNFAYLCDKLDFDLQMMLYDTQGYIDLSSIKDTPIYSDMKIQEILNNGAKTPSDVFYEYDKDKYNDNSVFKGILDYAYSSNLKDLLDKFLKK